MRNEANTIRIVNNFGTIEYHYHHDLADEQGDTYLPVYYESSVIEFDLLISPDRPSARQLIDTFLAMPEILEARLIFVDCSALLKAGLVMPSIQYVHDFFIPLGFKGVSRDGLSRL